jgi:hypothetical protein
MFYNHGAAVSDPRAKPSANEATMRRIDMDRRRCTVTADRIDIRPSRGSVLLPATGLGLGLLLFAVVVLWQSSLPFPLVVLLVLSVVLLLPFSGMGFVYSVAGAHVVVDRAKQSAVWQQGLLGMGVGTRELVPFWKIEQLEVAETVPQDQRGLPQDVAQFEVVLLKTSGRRLQVGAVTVPRSLATDGLDRARQVAEAIGGMADKPVQVPRPRRRRRRAAKPDRIPSGH